MYQNIGQEIAAEAAASRTEAEGFGRKRVAAPETSGALAFQIAVGSLDAWPADVPFDDWSARLIENGAADAANTIKLRELADW